MKWTLQGNSNNQKGMGFTDQGLEKITSDVRTPICKKQCVPGSNYFMSRRLGSLARAALVPLGLQGFYVWGSTGFECGARGFWAWGLGP